MDNGGSAAIGNNNIYKWPVDTHYYRTKGLSPVGKGLTAMQYVL